ncbi:transcription antitermination factor NusB [Planctomycetota bacterium]
MAKLRRRTRARELALQFLYMHDLQSSPDAADGLAAFFEWQHVSDAEIRNFARALVEGYFEHQEEIRERIFPLIKNWTEDRLTVVDRNILRMASYELSYEPDVPFKVTINEAIDLGKKYSTRESGKFVNGILDEFVRRYVPEKMQRS